MDVAELEDWYQQQRERLEERAMDGLQKSSANAQAQFETAYRKLIADYQRRQQQIYESEKRQERIRKPIARMHARIEELSRLPGAWFRLKVKQLRKWWFDRRIRRLLR